MTISYGTSPYAIRDDLVEGHRRVWDRLANAGTWLDGATRVQVAAEARHARGCPLCTQQKDALSPFGVRLNEVPITPPRLVQLIAAAAA